MTISKAQIFNITLNILGVSTPLENANCTDNRAILLNNYYELARDFVLKDFDWNFASAYKTLSLFEQDTPIKQFSCCYRYPNDCICAREVFKNNDSKLQKFVITSMDNGDKVILTNAQNAVLRYTRRVEKEVFFSCEFSMALSYYLASLTSSVLTGSLQKGEMAYEKYQKLLRHSKALNAQEGIDVIYDDNTYLEARG